MSEPKHKFQIGQKVYLIHPQDPTQIIFVAIRSIYCQYMLLENIPSVFEYGVSLESGREWPKYFSEDQLFLKESDINLDETLREDLEDIIENNTLDLNRHIKNLEECREKLNKNRKALEEFNSK